ncbi:stalk domain-containing protein [Alkalihalophilus marmarensis]|uniref:stalk domain-containing protein n=1 Tax=Alkalihalophilus marmarensis TaxID=521377 RepID=UPI00203F321C|nr:stalk domain-containing protein [Alkalihalophilus marmarensis]MCM3489978.1 stalk domain-containing protein [Alkalihalophilus marmarensis]
MKRVLMFLLFIVIVFLVHNPTAGAYQPINVMMNDHQLDMNAPVQLQKGTTMVPMRIIFEELGANIKWDQATRTVTATREGTEILLTIGSHTALVNGENKTLASAPYVYQQRTYVPLRFVSESLGAMVRWDQETRTVYIESNDKLTPSAQEIKLEVGNIQLGDTMDQVESLLGGSLEQLASSYSFDWHVYHEGYDHYMQIGIDKNEVTALYTNHISMIGSNNEKSTYTREQVRNLLGTPLQTIKKGEKVYRIDGSNRDTFDHKGAYVTVFYDKQRSDQATAIQIVKKEAELEKAGYVGADPAAKISDYERQLFLLTNAVRVREGEKALSWNDSVSNVARDHSEDMAENRYFNHFNQANETPFDRLDRAGIKYSQAGENLAFSHSDAIYAHEALWNSAGHRSNTLGTTFKQAGVGVAWNGETPYYTINFLNP